MKFANYTYCLFFSAFLFENSEGIKPTVGTVTESVYASGIIKADNQYTLLHRKWYFTKKKVTAGQPISQGSCF
jgi:hypothetical protein